jgi:hypothetical protein
MLQIEDVKSEYASSRSKQEVSEAGSSKIIDFFEARENLLEDSKEIDRQFELSQEVFAHRDLRKRRVLIGDPVEDAILLLLVVSIAIGFLLLAFGGSG